MHSAFNKEQQPWALSRILAQNIKSEIISYISIKVLLFDLFPTLLIVFQIVKRCLMTVVNMDTEQLEVVKAFLKFAAPCDFEQNVSSSHLSIMAIVHLYITSYTFQLLSARLSCPHVHVIQHCFTFFNICIGNDTIAVCMHKRAFKDCLVADGKWCLKGSTDRGKLLFLHASLYKQNTDDFFLYVSNVHHTNEATQIISVQI